MAVEEIELTPESLQNQSTFCPGTIFMLGARLEYLDDRIRQVDQEKHLCLGSILGSTPPVWVHKDGFYISRFMITNGDYRRFVLFAEEDEDGNINRLYDDPELWEYVWSDMNLRLTDLKMTYKVEDDTETMVENYQGASSFVEAYILSIKYEVERVLAGGMGGEVDEHLIETLFDYIRIRLWTLWDEEEEIGSSPGAQMTPEQAGDALTKVVADLYSRYAMNVDARFKQALRAHNLRVETILFLDRFKKAMKGLDPDHPIPIHKVIYPRFWKKPGGEKQKKFGGARFGRGNVPWDQQPVYGITLYEALAYTVWLGQQTDLNVTLPDEAEFERAAGWPLEGLPSQEPFIVVDPYRKSIFPWYVPGDGEFCDFNYFFGQEGRTLKEFYFHNDKEYQKLLEATAKRAPDGQDIYQLIGFGWQWTIDRFDPTEHKYNNFDIHNYPMRRAPECRIESGGDALPVFEYKPNANMSNSFFVVRGAPDVVGGPGTATRRFSMYPLRGHDNVGFRFVFRQT
ncbi:MAG: formylglycine-generating enzyme family protein [Planctomycetota bacterium]|jgi:formylglycine-generating enzyme required for sulfatase activity